MKKTPVFWLIAGTTEGRRLARELGGSDVLIYISLATDYGRWFIEKKENLVVNVQRLNKDEMVSFIRDKGVDCVIDATHPYAQEVTKNIAGACRETKTEYFRLLRPKSKKGDFLYAENSGHAAQILAEMPGKIFLTCGSKEIEAFTSIPDYNNRIYLRVLPEPAAIQKCLSLGYKPMNIICMQGPFSKELNRAMMKQIRADIMVTKDSGPTGGFQEKVEAASMLGLTIIVIGRPPEEEGYTYAQLKARLIAEYVLNW